MIAPVPLGGNLSPRQDREMSSEETDTSDSKEPDVGQSPSTDSKLPIQSNITIASGRTGDKTSSKVLTSSHCQAADAIIPDVKQKTFSTYTPSTAFKNLPLPNTCDGEDPSAAASTDPRDTIGKRLFYNMDLADQDLYGVEPTGSQRRSGRHGGLDARYDPSPHTPPASYSAHINADTCIGGFHSLPYTGTCAPAGSRRPKTRVTASTTATKAKVSFRVMPLRQGTSGYNDKYVNLRDISSSEGQHNFVELKKTSQPMSADSVALSNQPGANASRETGSDDKTWNCSRCTFLNSPEQGICAMCASSRRVNLVVQRETEIRVCGSCTFHNKAGTKVCEQCSKTLDLTGPPESCV